MLNTYIGTTETQIDLLPITGPEAQIPFAILACRRDCCMRLPHKDVALRQGDITLIRSVEPVSLAPLIAGNTYSARLFQVPMGRDADFGPNELIASMLATSEDTHIVFRRIDHVLANGYCDQLARLIEAKPQDAILDYEQRTIAQLLLTELSRWDLNAMMIIESNFPEHDLRHTPKARQAGIILNYVMRHLATVTLSTAATYFGYEANYFSRLCHQLFQKPFLHEVRFIRMNQAKKLLELTMQSISDIANSLGYKNPANFDRHFKAHTGMSPSAYRHQTQVK
ncbi:MAG: AraC family transcriptional regulator [Lacticaseibacillus paracasei]